MTTPIYLKPHALQPHPIVKETRLIRDMTMPEVGDKYDRPAYERLPARSVCGRSVQMNGDSP